MGTAMSVRLPKYSTWRWSAVGCSRRSWITIGSVAVKNERR